MIMSVGNYGKHQFHRSIKISSINNDISLFKKEYIKIDDELYYLKLKYNKLISNLIVKLLIKLKII